MDQGYVSTSAGHYVRLALIFCATVFGLLLLGFAFGSSSASADDGGPDDVGLVPAVAGAAGGAVEQFAPATPVTEAIPLVGVPLFETGATTVKVVDATMAAVVPILAPVLHSVPVLLPAIADLVVEVPAASILSAAGGALSGAADGLWLSVTDPLGAGTTGASGLSVSGSAFPAIAVGAGFFALFFSRRFGLVHRVLPVSPVFETDTSPD